MGTYVTIALSGFVVLLLTLMLGGGDHDFDHDADHDGGSDHHWFSLKVLSAFATAFGASGAIARAYGLPHGWALIAALAVGCIVGSIADFIITLFFRQQASSLISADQLVGRAGAVTLTIPPDSYGEVTVEFAGQSFSRRARSENAATSIRAGERVEILTASSSEFMVRKWVPRT